MAKKYETYITRDVISDMKLEKKLEKLDAQRTGSKIPYKELAHKEELEIKGRISYFTEVFEGIPLDKQEIEVEDIANSKEAKFFVIGRNVAKRLVDSNVANMDNYGEFCTPHNENKKHR